MNRGINQTVGICDDMNLKPQLFVDGNMNLEPYPLMHLDNLIADITGMPEGKEADMSNRIKMHVVIGGKEQWVTGETNQAIADKIVSAAIGTAPQKGQIIFHGYAENFMELYKRNKVRHTTIAGYNSYLRKHIYPFFGEIPIQNIAIDKVQEFLNLLQHLSAKTIREIMLVLKLILDAAVEDRIISVNPAKSRRLSITSCQSKKKREAYDEKEIQYILEHIMELRRLQDRRLLALAIFMPVRREDILGLQIKDFCLDNMTVSIERSVTFARERFVEGDRVYKIDDPVIGAPKTEAGYRSIPIVPQLWSLLAFTDEELADKEAFVLHHAQSKYKPYTGMTARYAWSCIKKTLKIEGKTLHCFRHTFATFGLRAGIPEKTMQTIGGWADERTMKRVYTHTQKTDIEASREKMRTMFMIDTQIDTV